MVLKMFWDNCTTLLSLTFVVTLWSPGMDYDNETRSRLAVLSRQFVSASMSNEAAQHCETFNVREMCDWLTHDHHELRAGIYEFMKASELRPWA
jgi:hypothetical protein